MTPELFIKNQICSWLTIKKIFFFAHDSVGIWNPTRKVFMSNKSPYRIKGVSDILGVLPGGQFLAIEVKAEKGRLTPEQKTFLLTVNLNGGVAFMARGINDVINEMQERGISL